MESYDTISSTGNFAQCYVAAWMGREFGEKWIHVCVWLSPFAVHQKWHPTPVLLPGKSHGLRSRVGCSP